MRFAMMALLALGVPAWSMAAEMTKGARWIKGDPAAGTITIRTADGIQQLKAETAQVKKWSESYRFGQRITVTFDNGTVEGLVRGSSEAEAPRDAALFELTMQILSSDTSKVRKIAVMDFGAVRDATSVQEEIKADELITLLHHTGRYDVVERADLAKVLAEDKLAAQGVITMQGGANLKKKLGIDAVLIGTVFQRTDTEDKRWTRVNARLVGLGGAILGAATVTLSGGDEATGSLQQIIGDLADQLTQVESEKGKPPAFCVADFSVGNETSEEGMWIAEELITRLAQSGKCLVAERRLLSFLLAEKRLAASGITEANAATLLKLMGANVIVIGKMQVQDGQIKLSTRTISKDARVLSSTEKVLRGKLASLISGEGAGSSSGGGTTPAPKSSGSPGEVRGYVWSPDKRNKDIPKEWKTSSLIDILDDKDGLRLEGRAGKHFCEVPGLRIRGDFVFEMQYHVYYSEIKVLFSGPGGKSLMLFLDNLGRNDVMLVDNQSHASQKQTNALNTVKLIRKDSRYTVELNGEKIFPARRVEQEPNFDTLRFEMNSVENATVSIHSFKIVPADKGK